MLAVEKMDNWFDYGEGYSALMYYYSNYDISGFDHRRPAPRTKGLEQMIEDSKFGIKGDLTETLEELTLMMEDAGLKGVYLPYTNFCKAVQLVHRDSRSNLSNRNITIAMREMGYRKSEKRAMSNNFIGTESPQYYFELGTVEKDSEDKSNMITGTELLVDYHNAANPERQITVVEGSDKF